MNRTIALGALAAGLAAWSVTAPGPRSARAADARKLLFTSNRDGNFDIYRMSADGSDRKNLTRNNGEDSGPSWSPDGERIVFASNRGGNFDLYVMNADGGGVKRLTNTPHADRTPAWSPDGKKIAFVRQVENESPELFVMNADGTEQRNLSNHPAYDADPAWSPDGKKLVFASMRRPRGFNLYLADLSGGEPRMIPGIEDLQGWIYPAWSPDGRKIAFTGSGGDALEIFTCDADGGNKKQLTALKGINTYAAWSPDGTQIAFQHHVNGNEPGEFYLMNADGTGQKAIAPAEAPVEGGRPSWKPK